MTLILAQINPTAPEPGSIQALLERLIPLPTIIGFIHQAMGPFVFVGIMMALIGFIMHAPKEDELNPLGRLIILVACMSMSLWLLQIAQAIGNGLVGAVTDVWPNMGWIQVNNPGDTSLALNYNQAYQVLGKWLLGNSTAPDMQPWELGKAFNYAVRLFFIWSAGLVAAITVFMMQITLIIQKLIIIFSQPFIPLMIGCLGLGAAKGIARHFFSQLLGVILWPVGWAVVQLGTLSSLENLTPPTWSSAPGEIAVSVTQMGIVCVWMVLGTIMAPVLIAGTVLGGQFFAQGIVGGFAGALVLHGSNVTKHSASVMGGLTGATVAGPMAAEASAGLAAAAGSSVTAPLHGMMTSAQGLDPTKHAVPTANSAAVARAALEAIKRG